MPLVLEQYQHAKYYYPAVATLVQARIRLRHKKYMCSIACYQKRNVRVREPALSAQVQSTIFFPRHSRWEWFPQVPASIEIAHDLATVGSFGISPSLALPMGTLSSPTCCPVLIFHWRDVPKRGKHREVTLFPLVSCSKSSSGNVIWLPCMSLGYVFAADLFG